MRKTIDKKLSEMTLEELWRLFPITLVEHDPAWAAQYAEEAAMLSAVLPPCARLHHVGSTAIDGIKAKPIVDILAVFPTAADLAPAADALCRVGYIVMSTEGKRISLNKGYTEKGYADRVFHLHLRVDGDADELYFRDYLNARPDIAAEYEKLKLGLAREYKYDRDAYTAAKTEFVTRYTELAKREAGTVNRL